MKLSKIISKNNLWFLLPVLSGILLFLAYPPQNLWFLIWLALIPLFWFLFSEKTTNKSAFWGTFACGFVFMGGLFVWLFYTAPFEWAGASSLKDFRLVLLLMIVLWLFQVVLLSLFWGTFGWLLKKIIRKNPGFFSFLLIIPLFWIIFEYLRSWWFEFIWLGKETYFGPHWTFGNLAYALYKIPLLIQSADIWGIYGISFLVVLINCLFFLLVKSFFKNKLSSRKNIALVLSVALIFVFFTGYGEIKLKKQQSGTEREIALIQTDFTSNNRLNAYQGEEQFNTILNLFKNPESLKHNPDFIFAPEGMGIVAVTGGTNVAKYLLGDFWKPGQIYSESKKIIDENGKIKSRLFYYELENEKPLAYYEKRLLIPNGDYLPYVSEFLLSVYSYKQSSFEQRLYKKGEIKTSAQTPKGNIGGTICSSMLSPAINRQMVNSGAQFLAVVASDAPFHKSESLLEQNLAMSQLRAVENRRYSVQSTNMGYSFLLNEKGKIILKSQNFGNEIIFGKIKLLDKKTPYTKYGDWLVFAAFFVLIAKLSYPQLLKFLLKKKKLYN